MAAFCIIHIDNLHNKHTVFTVPVKMPVDSIGDNYSQHITTGTRNNYNDTHDKVYGAVIMASHCESSLVNTHLTPGDHQPSNQANLWSLESASRLLPFTSTIACIMSSQPKKLMFTVCIVSRISPSVL